MQMTGNIILITGGTSDIGRGLAEAFHRFGNQVLIAGRRQSRLDEITEANPGMLAFQLDVRDPVAIEAFAARIRDKVPELNVLVNNAGISRPESLAAEPDLSIARDIVETNIMSVLQMTVAFSRHSRRSRMRRSSRRPPASPSCPVTTFRPIAPARRSCIPGCNHCASSFAVRPSTCSNWPRRMFKRN
ncbi:short-subunit dehydrogenase involved in D-alanine esterification of teichoic acids [Rhizobium mongolense]